MDVSTRSLRTACADLNGLMRGKRLPAAHAARLEFSGQRMPLSALNVDLWGTDIADSPLAFPTGDADGQLRVTDRGPVPMPWLAEPATLMPMWMFRDDGRAFEGDPRHALARVLGRYGKRGWRAIAATELEFSLQPTGGGMLDRGGVSSLSALDGQAAFFDALYAGAEAMGIPLQAAMAATGAGQFEVNLDHGPALRVADDTWLLRALVRGTAEHHGLRATFAAQPMAEAIGNGLHVHLSVLDRDGSNVFDNGLHAGTETMRRAVAGCVAGMSGSTLIFAPFGPSYARIVPGAHAPTGAAWGYENRTTAVRIPGGDPAGRRIEHRMPGADANPYLAMAAILGAALMGVEDALSPPEPVIGDAYQQRVLQCPTDWESATDRFVVSPKMRRIFPELLIDNLARTKRQEARRMADLASDAQFAALRAVL